ncbi:MAG: type II toxin-antitoxin system VapC family toxin [Treponema sp.]|nr:type II toxin-antitoxin system VapC family toxin [Treponema sp.]
MKYFLDTNVIIDAIKNKSPCLRQHFEETYTTDIFVSSIVVAELEFGAAHSNDYSRNKALYEQFIKDFAIVPFEKQYCTPYGELRHYLTKSGQVIGLNDMLIAATAIANGGILVTHNTAEFERIPKIQLADWTK